MKKWYIGITFMLVLFMISSTTAVAVDLRSLSLSNESAETPSSEESSDAFSSSESAEGSSSDSADQNSDSELDSGVVQSSEEAPQITLIGNQPPIAKFDYYQSDDDKYEFNFIDLSTDIDGEVIYWKWNFNDGTPNSISYEQNPVYNFEHISGHEITVFLTVGDDGDPQEKNSTSKIIRIPPSDPVASEIESETQSLTPSKSEESAEVVYSDLLTMATIFYQEFGSSLFISKVKNTISTETGLCLIGGDCDLYIYNVFYSPNPPELNHYLYFYFNVGDLQNNYYGTVDVEAIVPKLGIRITATVDFDGQTHELRFLWPNGATGSYDITLKVFPQDGAGWNEINWDDNSKTFNDVSPKTLEISSIVEPSISSISKTTAGSSSGSSALTSGDIAIIISTSYATNYGSFAL